MTYVLQQAVAKPRGNVSQAPSPPTLEGEDFVHESVEQIREMAQALAKKDRELEVLKNSEAKSAAKDREKDRELEVLRSQIAELKHAHNGKDSTRSLQQELADVKAQLLQLQAMQTQCTLVNCPPGDVVNLMASSQIQSSWAKKEAYEFGDVISVHRIENPYLEGRYNTYKSTLSGAGVTNGGEVLVFHGCTETAMDPANSESIVRTGFLKKYWKTSAGEWQRFGPGF